MHWNLQKICDGINKAINIARAPLSTIPAAILVCSAIQRPGLSSMLTAANIIRRQVEAGIPVGPAADGGANLAEAMERIRVEEIFKAIKMDMKVQIGIPIGAAQFIGTGANAGGPVVIHAFNTNAVHGDGIGG